LHLPGDVGAGTVRRQRELDDIVRLERPAHVERHGDARRGGVGDLNAAGAHLTIAVPGIGRTLPALGATQRALGLRILLERIPAAHGTQVVDQRHDAVGGRIDRRGALNREGVGLGRGISEHGAEPDDDKNGDDEKHFEHDGSPGCDGWDGVVCGRGSLLARRLLRLFLRRLLLGLELAQIGVEAVEALLPEPAIALEPFVDFLERQRLDAAGPPLRLAAAADQPGALEHLEMLGDGGAADVEWRGELGDRGLPQRQAGEDRPARGVGQRGEGVAKAIRCHWFTDRLNNLSVKYSRWGRESSAWAPEDLRPCLLRKFARRARRPATTSCRGRAARSPRRRAVRRGLRGRPAWQPRSRPRLPPRAARALAAANWRADRFGPATIRRVPSPPP